MMTPMTHLLLALLLFNNSSPVADGTNFSLKPGTCSTALDMIWEREIAQHDAPPGIGLPSITVDAGGEFVRETRILLVPGPNGKVQADIFQIADGPLCKQIEMLHESNKHGTLEAAIESIKVDHKVVKQSEGVALHYGNLLSHRIALTPSSSMYFPARGYAVSIEGEAGSIEIQLTAPEPTADGVAFSGTAEPAHTEVLEWIKTLLELLSISLGNEDNQ